MLAANSTDPAPFDGVAVLTLLFAAVGFLVACWAAFSSHRSAEEAKRSAVAAEDSAKEAKRANHLAERPDVRIQLGQAPDITHALGITIRSDTALQSIRIEKVETFINDKAVIAGEWKPSFVAQRSTAALENYDNTIVFSDVKVNHPLFVTWVPWHGHQGKRFNVRLDLAVECIADEGRSWTLAKTVQYDMPGVRGVQ